jgi:hypothetical protein
MESPQQMFLCLGSFVVGCVLFGLGALMLSPVLDWAERKFSISFSGVLAFLICWWARYLIVIWTMRLRERRGVLAQFQA